VQQDCDCSAISSAQFEGLSVPEAAEGRHKADLHPSDGLSQSRRACLLFLIHPASQGSTSRGKVMHLVDDGMVFSCRRLSILRHFFTLDLMTIRKSKSLRLFSSSRS
jgi:hypothetical protein